MSSLPPAYQRDASHIHALVGQMIDEGRDNLEMIVHARDLATQIRAFLTRWQNQPAVAAHDGHLTIFRSQLLSVERHLEGLHVATLIELLEFRLNCLHSRHILDLTHQLADLLQRATPHDRVEIERKLLETRGENFDLAGFIAETTAEIAGHDAEFDRLIDEYECCWPDRLDDTHYTAILHLEREQHDALAEELALLSAALADPAA
jgi:hypothetical protein